MFRFLLQLRLRIRLRHGGGSRLSSIVSRSPQSSSSSFVPRPSSPAGKVMADSEQNKK